jgi:hypothetical protein
MFEDLYDSLSLVLYRWWPAERGEITAIDIERIGRSRSRTRVRLAVAYKFSVGADGPYTGESFWEPLFFAKRRVAVSRRKLHIRQAVVVHYRTDDPTVNRLDRELWHNL